MGTQGWPGQTQPHRACGPQESSGEGEQLARRLEDGVSRALTGDAQAGRRLEEVNQADLGSLPGGGVKVMNLFIRLLGAGGRLFQAERTTHADAQRWRGKGEMSFQGHWGAIESFRAEVLSWGVGFPRGDCMMSGDVWLSPLRMLLALSGLEPGMLLAQCPG